MRKLDLKGKRFGRLMVIEAMENIGTYSAWLCQCDCGNKTIVATRNLQSGGTKSCGCLCRDIARESHTIHGLSRVAGKITRLYNVWNHMRHRCLNKDDPHYKYYGARGLTICQEWDDYPKFHDWALSNGYTEKLTIERIDNNSGYSPNNCRWATRKEQARNSRHNHRVFFNGEDKALIEWAEVLGVKSATLNMRLRRGWPIEKALTEPVK